MSILEAWILRVIFYVFKSLLQIRQTSNIDYCGLDFIIDWTKIQAPFSREFWY